MSSHPHQPSRADLADLVNELVDSRPHTERFQRDRAGVVESSTTRRGRVTARRVTRAATHATTIPSLLDALRAACIPGSAPEQVGAAGGAFESRPPAELEAVSVLREIRDDVALWARRYSLDTQQPLPKILRALVSVNAADDELTELTHDAQRWVQDARLAVGLDAQPLVMEDRCPLCGRKNAVVIYGVGLPSDRQRAKCKRCGVKWTHDQLGILADMLRWNREKETMSE